jgi:hypothetical protein
VENIKYYSPFYPPAFPTLYRWGGKTGKTGKFKKSQNGKSGKNGNHDKNIIIFQMQNTQGKIIIGRSYERLLASTIMPA